MEKNHQKRHAELEDKVPAHTLASIRAYVEDHICPGDFLTAVLSNDLKKAFRHADAANYKAMGDIVMYLYNCVPFVCWGSERLVEEWLSYSHRDMSEHIHQVNESLDR